MAEQISINDEYCWMHTPGGWTCTICREQAKQQGEQELCPFCPPDEEPNPIGDDFFGGIACMIDGQRCCTDCYEAYGCSGQREGIPPWSAGEEFVKREF
jgi:hypothetical protein